LHNVYRRKKIFSIKVDLHTHTNFSDGILYPESLVTFAFNRGVTLLSITDHDCLDAIPLAEKEARKLGISFVSGVELNTDFRGGEIHILGYCFNLENEFFQEKLKQQREYRRLRLQAMLEKLRGIGFDLDANRVHEIAGNGSVGRPHLALALIEKGYVTTVEEAFEKYLGYGKPGWVPRSKFTPQDAIQTILQAGGIPVLAHPGRAGSFSLEELVAWGLKGLEVFYPMHAQDYIEILLAEAKRYNLIVTAGSDYHGINPQEKGPGCVEMPEEFARRLQEILVKSPKN
jgi:predicted metal-dependent phosphoesterase TrpH